MGIADYVPMLIVLGLFGYEYYAYAYLLCIKSILYDEKLGFRIYASYLLGQFNILIFLTLVSYFQACFSDPGRIPDSFGTESGDSDVDGKKGRVEVKRTGNTRFCSKCNKHKPDRAHHCNFLYSVFSLFKPAVKAEILIRSKCDQCTLKMDHHCPWVCNCVGFRNYKFFMLFLLYIFATCILSAISMIPFMIFWPWSHLTYVQYNQIAALLIGLGLILMIGGFGGVHLQFVFDNVTTIESLEKRYARREGKKFVASPYDVGKIENFKQVFGNNVFLWFIPIFSSLGDGCHWPTRDSVKTALNGKDGEILPEEPNSADEFTDVEKCETPVIEQELENEVFQ